MKLEASRVICHAKASGPSMQTVELHVPDEFLLFSVNMILLILLACRYDPIPGPKKQIFWREFSPGAMLGSPYWHPLGGVTCLPGLGLWGLCGRAMDRGAPRVGLFVFTQREAGECPLGSALFLCSKMFEAGCKISKIWQHVIRQMYTNVFGVVRSDWENDSPTVSIFCRWSCFRSCGRVAQERYGQVLWYCLVFTLRNYTSSGFIQGL